MKSEEVIEKRNKKSGMIIGLILSICFIIIAIVLTIVLMQRNTIKSKMMNGDYEKIKVWEVTKSNYYMWEDYEPKKNVRVDYGVFVRVTFSVTASEEYRKLAIEQGYDTDYSYFLHNYMKTFLSKDINEFFPNCDKIIESDRIISFCYGAVRNPYESYKECIGKYKKIVKDFFKSEDCKNIISLNDNDFIESIIICQIEPTYIGDFSENED